MIIPLAVFAASASFGLKVYDRFATALIEAEQQSAKAELLPIANIVAASVGRHASQMSGLVAFAESADDEAELRREFDLFGAGLKANSTGISSIQIVRDGRIWMVYPRDENRAAIGLNLRDSKVARTRDGYRRAMSSDAITVFGPARLMQGGSALVIDLRLHARYDPHLDFAAMLVDMRSVVSDLKLAETRAAFAISVLAPTGLPVDQSTSALPADPQRVEALVSNGNWKVLGGPTVGWDAAVEQKLRPVRLLTIALVLALTIVAWLITGRNARLTSEVEARTASLRHLVDERSETIRQQHETERALATSEERLRLALTASLTATFEADVASDHVTWSPEVGPMFGLPPGESPGTIAQALRFTDPVDAARIAAEYAAVSRDAGHGTIELRLFGQDGVTRWIALYWLSRSDPDGVVRRVIGTLTDITERKALEEQFLHAQKMQAMGALAGGIAHDFNNLLTVILGAGQMARAEADSPHVPETIRTDLDEVLGAGERASVLTGQLLAFSRRQVVQRRHFDACDFVGGMGTMLRRLVGEQIRVETALPGTRIPLYADQGQLTQVVMNLAVNARDAMKEGGILRISLRAEGRPAGPSLPNESLTADRYAVLSVSDTGTGIDPAIRPLIFDPFFTTKPVGQGTGLGLATVYGIVMQLGGTIRLISAMAKGSTFDIYLPLSADADDDAPAAVALPGKVDGAGRTVLLAEDEAGLRRVVERVLTDAGYRLIVAEDGPGALAAARAYDGVIDLLVSDVVMPGIGGFELASALVADRPTSRVLFMSGYPQGAGEGAALPFVDAPFIAKPFKPTDLLAACRRALADT